MESAVCLRYGIKASALYGINPKEDTRYRVMPYAYGDYILTCGEITYQSFGLDRKSKSFDLLFLAPATGIEPITNP